MKYFKYFKYAWIKPPILLASEALLEKARLYRSISRASHICTAASLV